MIRDPAEILGVGGPIARVMGGGYEPRAEQVEMARAVARTLEARGRLLVEAGTGVGKSFAYLVPSIQRCLAKGEVVVVATHTIALQEQLVERDIPLLKSTIADASPGVEGATDAGADWRGDLRPVLVKGRGNYLSIRRLKLASQRQDRLLGDAAQRRSLHAIEDWAYSTTDGTLATLPQLERPEVWEHAQSDADNCMGRRCPHHGECFYQNARRAAESANLLVCNHAIFFADMALRADGRGLLPDHQHVVIDEAHNVEEVAAEQLGTSLAEPRVHRLVRTLYDDRRRKGYLDTVRLAVADAGLVDAAIESALRAGHAGRDFFDAWLHLVESGRLPGGRVRSPGLTDNPLTPALKNLATRLLSIRDALTQEADRFELNAYARRAEAIAQAAASFVDQSAPASVYWAEVDEGRGGRRVRLVHSPVEVGPVLRELLFSGDRSVVLTSATLSVASRAGSVDERGRGSDDRGFGHIRRRVGCDDGDTLLLGSPFRYDRQVRFIVDRSVPAPPKSDSGAASEAYHDRLADAVIHHAVTTGGGAFVLCTSFRSVWAIADRVRGPLTAAGLTVLVQGRDGPRSALLSAFREHDRSVLVGAASFWQGIDVRGRALRNVIIARLPFDPPDRPLTQARMEAIAERGGDPFREESLPRAIIRFKQGFGRLVRSHTDTGRIVVLDPRILTTGYGRMFLRALPPGVEPEEPEAAEPDETWTRGHWQPEQDLNKPDG